MQARASRTSIFLAEAFTRPKVMYRLAKLGFTQSYTYFTWRNTKRGADRVLHRADRAAGRASSSGPNFWPNTPDILTEYLQIGGRAGVRGAARAGGDARRKLRHLRPGVRARASTSPREPGSEEYLDSEKYQVRHWDLERPDSLRELIARVNRIRRENPALQHDRGAALPRRSTTSS